MGAVMVDLEHKLDVLIAKELGVTPEEVTTEFIHNWRVEHIYPCAKYDFTSHYGGYTSPGKILLNSTEIEEMTKRVDEFLAQFS